MVMADSGLIWDIAESTAIVIREYDDIIRLHPEREYVFDGGWDWVAKCDVHVI